MIGRRLICLFFLGSIFLMGTMFGAVGRADVPATFRSVVSVLPVWKGRPQGGGAATRAVAPEGSGVIVRPGVVATAWHVVEPAERIDVRLNDGRVLPARLIASDPKSDIALLGLDADSPPIEFGASPQLAAPVCAIGNAFGLGLSVSCGVVSAQSVTDAGFNPIEDFVQTDAAINPGMSGGALVDGEGKFVGLLSAIFASDADTNIGVNFAVSTALLQRVTEALLASGSVSYASVGWRLEPADRAQLRKRAGAAVGSVDPQGPAARAGLESGDLIVRIAARRIKKPRDAMAALAVSAVPGTQVEVLFERDGTERGATLQIGDVKLDPGREAPGVVDDACPHVPAVCLFRQAVFPISSFDPIASATRIGPKLLVTNRHVVADRETATIHTPTGSIEAKVQPSAYMGDLAVLQVEELPESGLVPSLDQSDVSGDESFFAVGADIAQQSIRVFEPGSLIARPADGAEFGRLHVTSRMQPGVSGGALINGDGELVGIAVGGGEGRFEAIPIGDIQQLLALRSADDAPRIHRKLGRAIAGCTELLDRWEGQRANQSAAKDIEDKCLDGDNHGQFLRAGRVLARSGFFAAAARLLGRAVEKVPNSINARASLLVSLQLGGRFEDMVPHARRLMGMAPDDPRALRFAVQSGVWGGDSDLAEAAYGLLLEADPRQAQAARRFIDDAPPAPPKR